MTDVPQCLSTARLTLRPPQSEDALAFHQAMLETLPDLRRFLAALPWVAVEQSIASAQAFCDAAQANFAQRKDLPYLLFEKSGGELVGAVGLHRPDWTVPKAEVGYWCRASKQGQGFITEAVQALVAMAFEQLGMKRLGLVTDEENEASRQVAERCGFALEALVKRDRRGEDGSLRNSCWYARFPAE